MNPKTYLPAIVLALSLYPSIACAAPNGKTAVSEVLLTDSGKAVETKYAAMQIALKADIGAALPKPDAAKIAAWLEAILAEEGPAKEAAAAFRKPSSTRRSGKTAVRAK